MPPRGAVISLTGLILTLLTIPLYGGAIPYDTICSNNYYTIRGNDPVPSDTPHHYAWVVSSDGGASWQRIPNSNHRDLTITEPLSGMTNMQVRRYLYKRYIFSPQQTSQSEIVGLVMAKGYTLSRTTDTVTPCVDSKGFQIITPLPATFEWRCVESGKTLQPQKTENSASKYVVRIADLKNDEDRFPLNLCHVVLTIKYSGGATQSFCLPIYVSHSTVNPFDYGDCELFSDNAWEIKNGWSGQDRQMWTISSNTSAALGINEATGELSGLASVARPSSTPDLQHIATIDAVCYDYPDVHYQALLTMETNPAPTIPGTSATSKDFNYTGAVQSITLGSGAYQFECWGASGGAGAGGSNPLGYGGYTRGHIAICDIQQLFLYVGEYGNGVTPTMGFNGGGRGAGYYDGQHNGGRGGGASDIRLIGGSWNNPEGLRSRIMVAGGGGGAMPNCGGRGATAGHGGGLTGTTSRNTNGHYVNNASTGGGQTAGGTWIVGNDAGNNGNAGTFGIGGVSWTCAGGGGGGYYGGGSHYTAGGGGGSSFISGLTGCNAVDEKGIHSNQPKHYSGLAFKYGTTSTGVRSGHGLIRITGIIASIFRIAKN